ncbi:hypothetical protein QJ854_gp262 [Moumouvirus goulette]|uniref:Uncharacterized protein n=1 Tax=Moumouvirus goulette TaxID=1247379 RepID=M1NN97_9VIRU|nr:hypothetical protein QJ854_gp262 [Moumouvirus goulette]AGF85520.1 hypothetical protein glt_00715 [Moumouvirus goulette]
MSGMIRSDSCYYIAEPRTNLFWANYNSSRYNSSNNINITGIKNSTYGYILHNETIGTKLHGNISGQFPLGPLASGPFIIKN